VLQLVRTPDAAAGARGAPTPAELYREHAAFVARLAHRLLGHDGDVDDVVHDVFTAMLVQYRTLSHELSLRGWLATVTVRAARKRLRWKWMRLRLGFEARGDFEAIAEPDAPHDTRLFLSALYASLERLPPGQRLAWSLRHLEGEDLETVAVRCEISLATAKRRIAAAQAQLGKEFEAWKAS
jgi:RNA polymerase sigma-70 factor (ECF subfamily)